MYFVVLVEDLSGKKALDILIPQIIGDEHSFRVDAYKGIGHIPKNCKSNKDLKTRKLLNDLPKMLQAYGKTFAGYGPEYPAAVFVVCDLDTKTFDIFYSELDNILTGCNPCPETRFCIAIEEGEAWLLGDIPAIKTAYPNAKGQVLDTYINDSICGTWETLADAIHKGGSAALIGKSYIETGKYKSEWAEQICPHMDINKNLSPSFKYFRNKLRELAVTY